MASERFSVQPGDPVLLRRALVRLRTGSSRSLGCIELAKEALEASWRDDRQEATRSCHQPSVRVRYPPRREDDRTGAGRKFLLSDPEHMLSLDHVEELVLVRVDVEPRVERIDLLDDREGAAGAFRTRLDDEHRSRKRQALAGPRVEAVCPYVLKGDAATLASGPECIHLAAARLRRHSDRRASTRPVDVRVTRRRSSEDASKPRKQASGPSSSRGTSL